MKIKAKYIILILYTIGNILLITPLYFILIENRLLINIKGLLIFHLDLKTIIFLTFFTIIILFYDLFIFNNKIQFIKNNFLLVSIFGIKNNIIFNLIISSIGGLFEELLFRAYLFFLFLFLIKKITNFSNLYIEVTIIVIISLIFAILHINQGLEALLLAFTFSLIFFVSIKVSKTIWYPIIYHSIFNFIEISVVYPLQRKKFSI